MLTIWARLSLHESLTEMKSETRDKLKLHALMKEDIILVLAGRGSSLGNQIAVLL